MSRTRWLAVAGVGALAVMALLIPGGAGAVFSGSGNYSGRVNGAGSGANVRVVTQGSNCRVDGSAPQNYASVIDSGSNSLGGATKVIATLWTGANGTGQAGPSVTITSYGAAGRQPFGSSNQNFTCGSTGSVSFQPQNASNQNVGTRTTFAVSYTTSYVPPQ